MDFELCLAFSLFFVGAIAAATAAVVVALSIVQSLLHFEFNDTIYPSVELQQQQQCKGSPWNDEHEVRVEMMIKSLINPFICTSDDSIHPFVRLVSPRLVTL